MGKEIERKWLLGGIPTLRKGVRETLRIEEHYATQAYLNLNPEVRIRKIEFHDPGGRFLGHDYLLTIKSSGGLVRDEVETYLNYEQYRDLSQMAMDQNHIDPVFKRWKGIWIDDHTKIELNVVDPGTPTEHVYCEVEFNCSPEVAMNFDIREAIAIFSDYDGTIQEVTHDSSYKMKNYYFREDRLQWAKHGTEVS